MLFLTMMVFVSLVYYIVVYGQPVSGGSGSHNVLNYFKNLNEDDISVNFSDALDDDANATTVAGRNASLYPINKPRLCDGREPVSVLIMVVTAPNNSEARGAIRRTWGTVAQRTDVHLVFVLGRPGQESVQSQLVDEDRLHRDIVQGNFLDAYYNLTVKSVLILKWASTYCKRARFVLKIDDDCFLHPPNLLKMLESRKEDVAIFGRLWQKVKPIRDKSNKWSVPVEDFPGKEFPDYTGGPSYVMTGKAVARLYEAVGEVRPLDLEDIYVTGLCAQKANVTRINDNRFSVSEPPRVCASRDVVTYHRVSPDLMYLLWWAINDSKFATCASKDDNCDKHRHNLVMELTNLVLTNLH